MAMSYEFERHINESRKRRNVRAVDAWMSLHGLFYSLAQANIISELPKPEIISTDAPLSETRTPTENIENGLVTVNGAKLKELRVQRRNASFIQFAVGKHIGQGPNFISSIETGKRPKIPSSIAIKLAELYQAELTTFLPNPEEVKKVEQLRKTLREKDIK